MLFVQFYQVIKVLVSNLSVNASVGQVCTQAPQETQADSSKVVSKPLIILVAKPRPDIPKIISP